MHRSNQDSGGSLKQTCLRRTETKKHQYRWRSLKTCQVATLTERQQETLNVNLLLITRRTRKTFVQHAMNWRLRQAGERKIMKLIMDQSKSIGQADAFGAAYPRWLTRTLESGWRDPSSWLWRGVPLCFDGLHCKAPRTLK